MNVVNYHQLSTDLLSILLDPLRLHSSLAMSGKDLYLFQKDFWSIGWLNLRPLRMLDCPVEGAPTSHQSAY